MSGDQEKERPLTWEELQSSRENPQSQRQQSRRQQQHPSPSPAVHFVPGDVSPPIQPHSRTPSTEDTYGYSDVPVYQRIYDVPPAGYPGYPPPHIWTQPYPPPPPPPAPADVYDGYGYWSQPAHPLLRGGPYQEAGYGAMAPPQVPPRQPWMDRRDASQISSLWVSSSESEAQAPASTSAVPQSLPQSGREISQTSSLLVSSSESESVEPAVRKKILPPPPPPSYSGQYPGQGVLSSSAPTFDAPLSRSRASIAPEPALPDHRRSHSATESQTTPLLSQHQPGYSYDAPIKPASILRRGPTGKAHHRTSSLGRAGLSPATGISDRKRDSSLPPQIPGHKRASSLSKLIGVTPTPIGGGSPRHRRGDSISSMASVTSVGSVVSDITKSALFRGVTETGKIVFHTPNDKIHLKLDPDLKPGILYRVLPDDPYDDLAMYDEESVYLEENPCNCKCANCTECLNRNRTPVPDNYYALTIEPDLYKRVLSEVSYSRTMPCGLYFCGHHEDVSYPSIFIAVGIVLSFLIAMVVVAWIYGG